MACAYTHTPEELVKFIKSRLEDKDTCAEVIDSGEILLSFIWKFNSRLLGDGGTRAIFNRAHKLAIADNPLLQKVKVSDEKVDFVEFRSYVADRGCSISEVVDAILHLAMMTVAVISDLTGEVVIAPLLRQLAQGASRSGSKMNRLC